MPTGVYPRIESELTKLMKIMGYRAASRLLDDEKIEKIRERDKKYQRRKRANLEGYKTEEYRNYCKKYPEKVKAHKILNYAIMKGKIKKSPCIECETMQRVQGHHPDYSKPLEVVWVCPIHHKNYHSSRIVVNA